MDLKRQVRELWYVACRIRESNLYGGSAGTWWVWAHLWWPKCRCPCCFQWHFLLVLQKICYGGVNTIGFCCMCSKDNCKCKLRNRKNRVAAHSNKVAGMLGGKSKLKQFHTQVLYNDIQWDMRQHVLHLLGHLRNPMIICPQTLNKTKSNGARSDT